MGASCGSDTEAPVPESLAPATTVLGAVEPNSASTTTTTSTTIPSGLPNYIATPEDCAKAVERFLSRFVVDCYAPDVADSITECYESGPTFHWWLSANRDSINSPNLPSTHKPPPVRGPKPLQGLARYHEDGNGAQSTLPIRPSSLEFGCAEGFHREITTRADCNDLGWDWHAVRIDQRQYPDGTPTDAEWRCQQL